MPPGDAARASVGPRPQRQLPAPRLAGRGNAMTSSDMTLSAKPPLLDVRGLRKHYPVVKRGLIGRRQTGIVRAVDDVSFVLQAGQTLGLVGESGCGKTTTARSILDLVRADSGEIRLDGNDVRPILAGKDRAAMLA